MNTMDNRKANETSYREASRRFTADSPLHSFACACRAEVVDVRPDPAHGGIATVSADGRICCSEFEGDFGRDGVITDPVGAEKQAAMTKDWMWKRSHDIFRCIFPQDDDQAQGSGK